MRKIAEPKQNEICMNPEHKPPMHIYLTPGTYEHVCPSCGHKTIFTVPLITF